MPRRQLRHHSRHLDRQPELSVELRAHSRVFSMVPVALPRARHATPRHAATRLCALLGASLAACAGEPAAELGSSSSALVNTEIERLVPTDPDLPQRFGSALDAHGNTLVVGAQAASDNGYDAGKAYVYTRNAGMWQQEAVLLPATVSAHQWYGARVAVHGDTIAVTAMRDSQISGLRGKVYIFKREGGAWLEQATLEPTGVPTTETPMFGYALALDDDTIVVGAPGEQERDGAAYIYEYDGTAWVEQARLAAPPNASTTPDSFGVTVALYGDTVAIGAPGRDTVGPRAGAVYVYTRTGTSWQLGAELQPADPAAEKRFGAYGMDMDGNTLLIAAIWDQALHVEGGAAYVFVRDAGGAWTQQAKLVAGDPGAHQLGRSLALLGDVALIGAPNSPGATAEYAGAAYLFMRRNGAWAQRAKLVASHGEMYEYMGWSVALLDNLALAGTAYGQYQYPRSGHVDVFEATDNCPDYSGSWNDCTPECPCTEGQGDCDTDADCAIGHFCLHDGGFAYGSSDPELDVCVPYCPTVGAGARNFCSAECPCAGGEGDCDSSSECEDGLRCLDNVGTQYGYSDPDLDVCGCPSTGQGSSSFCSSACPCDAGEGDCDSDSECEGGLMCSRDVGATYGYGADVDVCEPVAASLLLP